ncbi:hypothetical protein THIX_60102 [Thiomonas sp. X19]|uniref:Arm DNA-binding domain-containing protein n=1 Tax=Thiomonas sp. X19 TaxID=1050370 RepID=UPI000B763688|nr:Arm DNA-binding domain-containing protein [Thiomonas sp. X19]SCC94044.1 hypothetical protein THIX_60102 [Thiomonas sp. X19]
MALALAQIKAAKSSDKPMKLSDEHGMYLFVNQSGKYWRFDYRFGGKRKTMSIGVFPAVGLAQARRLSDFAVFRMKTLSETIAAAQPRARADEPLRPC